jgi:small subunit ribosomal protein S17
MATTKTKTAAPAKGEKPAKAPAPKKEKPVQSQPIASDDKVMQHLKLHGKEFVGVVISDRANKTVTVEWERRKLIPKYERYERRYSRVYAHNPTTIGAKLGDTVRIKETRPLSKTKNFVVVEVMK